MFEVKVMENEQSLSGDYFEVPKLRHLFKCDYMPRKVSQLRLVKVDIE
jgi:hypothetical protein